jgi:hypothetical protein
MNLAVEIKGKLFENLEVLVKQYFSSGANRHWEFPTPFRPHHKAALMTREYAWGRMVFLGLKEIKPYEGSEWSYLVDKAPKDCRIVLI